MRPPKNAAEARTQQALTKLEYSFGIEIAASIHR